MKPKFLFDSIGWGFIIWIFGYILSIVLFFAVPPECIGWIIMPFGIAFTIWVLMKMIKSTDLKYYILLGVVWLLIAMVMDHFLIVKAFNPEDGYYKPAVYLYYVLTFSLPILVGTYKRSK